MKNGYEIRRKPNDEPSKETILLWKDDKIIKIVKDELNIVDINHPLKKITKKNNFQSIKRFTIGNNKMILFNVEGKVMKLYWDLEKNNDEQLKQLAITIGINLHNLKGYVESYVKGKSSIRVNRKSLLDAIVNALPQYETLEKYPNKL